VPSFAGVTSRTNNLIPLLHCQLAAICSYEQQICL